MLLNIHSKKKNLFDLSMHFLPKREHSREEVRVGKKVKKNEMEGRAERDSRIWIESDEAGF